MKVIVHKAWKGHETTIGLKDNSSLSVGETVLVLESDIDPTDTSAVFTGRAAECEVTSVSTKEDLTVVDVRVISE